MINLSETLPFPIIAGVQTPAIASRNMQIIYDIINNPDADDFDIMVDVGGVIFLAPYDDGTNVFSLLDGNAVNPPPSNSNRANWCLTFQYGSSFATSNLQGTIMSFRNFQVEASEKAFLFETTNENTRVNVTDLYNSEVSVCWFGAVAA
jgi:hypothetical protein